MQAMPDSVIAVSNGIMRFEGPGRYAKDVDLDARADEDNCRDDGKEAHLQRSDDGGLRGHSTCPTTATSHRLTRRSSVLCLRPPSAAFRTGGFAVPKDLTRADYRASWAKMVALLARMHEAGIPIVAGTDGSGIELIRELEIYTQAGFTPAEALAAATIVPARLVGMEQHTGSIKVGKTADLALVEGDPSTHITDLRQTRMVMLDGNVLDADALRNAAGYSGRPK